MEKNEATFYLVTLISFILVLIIVIGLTSNVPSLADDKILGLTGNVAVDLRGDFVVGDSVSGRVFIDSDRIDSEGVLLLMRVGEPVVTKTFNLKDIARSESRKGYYIELESLADYVFEEEGEYELFFSALDLGANFKKTFFVSA